MSSGRERLTCRRREMTAAAKENERFFISISSDQLLHSWTVGGSLWKFAAHCGRGQAYTNIS